jgi:hypothetical protein
MQADSSVAAPMWTYYVEVLPHTSAAYMRCAKPSRHLAIDDMAATLSTAPHCARRTAPSRLVSSCAFSDRSCDALHAAFQPPRSPLVSTSTDAAGTSAAIRTSALDREKFREGNEICSSVKAPEAVIYLCHHSTTTTTACSAFTSSLSPSPRATPLPHTHNAVLKIITDCEYWLHPPTTQVLTSLPDSAACNTSMARPRLQGSHGLQVCPRVR